MTLDLAFLESFRDRFAQKEPDPRHLIRRVTKFDLYLRVRDLVDRHRAKGYSWDGIAERFQELGVPISASTLKTCARRARAKSQRASAVRVTSPRPARPSSPTTAGESRTEAPAAPAPTVPPIEPPVVEVQSTTGSEDATGSRKEDSSPEPANPPIARAAAAEGAARVEADSGGSSEVLSTTALPTDGSNEGNRAPSESVAEVHVLARHPSSPARETEVSSARLVAAARARPARRMAFQPQRDEDL